MRRPFRQRIVVRDLLAATRAERAVEIGVGGGQTSVGLLRHFPGLFLIMVDPWIAYQGYSPAVERSAPKRVLHRWVERNYQQAVQSTEFAADRRLVLRMTSEKAAERPETNDLDLVFIDGNHDEPFVRADLNLYWPKLRLGGILCGHDWSPTYRPGVVAAVGGFVSKHRLPLYLELVPEENEAVGWGEAVWWTRKPE